MDGAALVVRRKENGSEWFAAKLGCVRIGAIIGNPQRHLGLTGFLFLTFQFPSLTYTYTSARTYYHHAVNPFARHLERAGM